MAKGLFIFVALTAFAAVVVGGSMTSEIPEGASEQGILLAKSPSGPSRYDRASEDGVVELQRSGDGHFYADIEINGATVRALVDTGASAIALSREDALSAGVPISISMPNVVGRGADGEVYGEPVILERVALGHRTAQNMRAIVLNSGEQTLLGQNFLARFDSVEIRGDRMVLR